MTRPYLSPDHLFHDDGIPTGRRAVDCWQWAMSRLDENTQRGVLAEFIGLDVLEAIKGPRESWRGHDGDYRNVGLEFKCAAYIQAWEQPNGFSDIEFDIAPKKQGTTNYTGPKVRPAAVYIFALLAHQDRATLDPTNMGQFRFWVVRTTCLPAKDSIRPAELCRLVGEPVRYRDLRAAVDRAIDAIEVEVAA